MKEQLLNLLYILTVMLPLFPGGVMVRFQTVQGELDSIGIDPENVCTYCWTGKE